VSGDAGGEGRAKELPFRRFSGKEPPFWGSLDMFGAGFQNHKPTRLRSLARARHRSVGSSLGASASLELCQHVDAGID